MRVEPARLDGVLRIVSEPAVDARGSFARTFCETEFAALGLCTRFVQCSAASNTRAGTVRGMHWQAAPHGETKLIRCSRGAVHDVLLDLRPEASSFGQWEAFSLTAQGMEQLYVPPGIAHGYQSLTDDCEVCYMIDRPYCPEAARGVRHDDPAFDIRWPLPVTCISDRDRKFPDYPGCN